MSPHSTAVSGGGSHAPNGSNGSKRNMPVVLGSIVVALLAVGGLITFLSMGDDKKTDEGGDPTSSESSVAAEHKGPERNRVLDKDKCTEASEDSDDSQKVQAPSFMYKDILSVKDCINAAGWTVEVIKEEGNTYAEDQIVNQFPSSGTAVPENGAHFELRVATGDPA